MLSGLKAANAMAASSTWNPVYDAAKLNGSELLLDSFRPEYLSYAFAIESNLTENKNETPEICAMKLLDKMKASAAAVEKENRLHDTMDLAHFHELVTSKNAYVTSGVDRVKGRKVLFLRLGRICKG